MAIATGETPRETMRAWGAPPALSTGAGPPGLGRGRAASRKAGELAPVLLAQRLEAQPERAEARPRGARRHLGPGHPCTRLDPAAAVREVEGDPQRLAGRQGARRVQAEAARRDVHCVFDAREAVAPDHLDRERHRQVAARLTGLARRIRAGRGRARGTRPARAL